MATASIYLDTRYESPEGGYVVKLRVTDSRKTKYYPTSFKKDAQENNDIPDTLNLNRKFTKKEFDAIMNGKRLTDQQREYRQAFASFLDKANESINALKLFSFDSFEKLYVINRGAKDSLKAAFDAKAKELRREGKINSAIAFECTITSLEKFKKGLRLGDVTADVLKAYEKYMIDNGRTVTTVGIYLRQLRVIVNDAIAAGLLDKSLYPFRKAKAEKGKYVLKGGRNIKKAIGEADLIKLFYYQTSDKAKQQARDFWVLSYLLNGMNFKDLLSLKWKDFDGEFIRFTRAKTVDSKENNEAIVVHVKDEAKAIINKYSVKSLTGENYIFPVLNTKMDAEERQLKVANFIHLTNDKLKLVCEELEIQKVTTYHARHSFATRLMQHGASVTFIQKSLGHATSKTTAAYLGSFENEAIKTVTDVLIPKQEVG